MIPPSPSYDLLRDAIVAHPVLRGRSKHSQHVYLTSNEEKIENVRRELFSKQISKGIYCGVSGLQNWDFISITKPELALLIDNNQAVVDFQNAVINLIKRTPDRFTFLRELSALVTSYPKGFFTDNFLLNQQEADSTPVLEIDKLWEASFGAFSSKSSFKTVRKLALAGNIISFPLDLTNEIAVSELSTMIKTHHCYFSCLYLSNVGDWVHRDAKGVCEAPNLQAFKRNINRLISPTQTHILESTWFGYDTKRYKDGDYQMVLSILSPRALEDPSHPYDPCIFRGAVPNAERSSYFEHSVLLDPLPKDARGEHKKEVSSDRSKRRRLSAGTACPT